MKNTADTDTTHTTVAIIGGGIAGMSVAAELADRHSVVVLEREPHPGYHATGRSAAYFSPAYGNAVVRALTDASEAFYTSPPSGFSEAPLLRQREALHITPRGAEATLETAIQRSSSLQPLPLDKAMTAVPVLSPDYVGAAALEIGGGDLNVDAILTGYRKRVQRSAGTLWLNSDVRSINKANGEFEITLKNPAGDHHLCASVVINAAGAWADQIAMRSGAAALGLQPKRRTAYLIKPPTEHPTDQWPMVINQIDPLYFKPDAGALLVSPMDETPAEPCDAAPDELDIAIAMERLHSCTSLNVQHITHRWAGLRTFAADETFVVGFDPKLAGFFWLAGQGGYGVQTAPALSRLAAAMVDEYLGGTISRTAPEWMHEQALAPARFVSD